MQSAYLLYKNGITGWDVPADRVAPVYLVREGLSIEIRKFGKTIPGTFWKKEQFIEGPGELLYRIAHVTGVERTSSEGRKGSATAGAITGGLLLGPVGALAGAFLGTGSRGEHYIIIACDVAGPVGNFQRCVITFTGASQEVAKAQLLLS